MIIILFRKLEKPNLEMLQAHALTTTRMPSLAMFKLQRNSMKGGSEPVLSTVVTSSLTLLY